MKALRYFFVAFILGTSTVGVQLGLSVAGFGSVASSPLSTEELKPATLQITLRKRPNPVPLLSKTARSYTATMVKPAIKKNFLTIVDQTGIRTEHKLAADAMLRLLPTRCTDKLKNFYVRYDNPKQRGLAGASTVILSGNVSMPEFIGLLTHEALGHFYDLGCLTGTSQSGDSSFRDGGTIMYNDDPSVAFYRICFKTSHTRNDRCTDTDFVSGYSKTDTFEDIAESIAYYTLQPESFRERAKTSAIMAEKLAWMERYAPVKHKIANGTAPWNGTDVPWDVTRLPYKLNIAFAK